MINRNKVKSLVFILIFVLIIFSPTIFAQGKSGLAHLVQEHSEKIAQMEDKIKNLGGTSGANGSINEDVKESLLIEATRISDAYKNSLEGGFNVHNPEIHEIDGKVVIQLFIEGNYDSKELEPDGQFKIRYYSQYFVEEFDTVSKMYGVQMNFQFYLNGERITRFESMN